MRNNSKDATIKRNYIQVYQHYILEHEAVKRGEHKQYRRVGEFYAAHKLQRQTFLKYYGRYRNSGGDVAALEPQKRGARWRTRRTAVEIEEMVLEWREHCLPQQGSTHQKVQKYRHHILFLPPYAPDFTSI